MLKGTLMGKLAALLCFLLLINCAYAQKSVTLTDTAFKPGGKLWGYAFGDYYYKAHSDSLNRNGNPQYTGIEKGRNAFQFRRIYLGYNYDISPRFSAEVLLAAEDNITTSGGISTGDLLQDNKLTFYIKLANLRWKNIWKGTDLVLGQASTPAFSLLAEPTWGYRSIEKTITDIHRMPSFDLGASLQGKFDPETGNYGYNVMIGNGTGDRPEGNRFKHFYGNLWAKLLDKKLLLDFFADYERFDWTASFKHSRNMYKGFVAYTVPKVTVGVEAFISRDKQDVIGVKGAARDTINANAAGLSAFVRGPIIQNKLGFFARKDWMNPDTKYDNGRYASFTGLSAGYDPNNRESFAVAGLDFTPDKNVHVMPNVWYNQYKSQLSGAQGAVKKDHDLVYRITLYYVFGK